MFKSKLNLALGAALLFAGVAVAPGQDANPTPLLTQTEAKWIAVLKSDAPQKEKADACRELAVIGTKNAVAALAAMLSDETMNHMARYGLETIPDPSVDAALRNALGKLKGRPLAGVIGSIGVRRDGKATDALTGLMSDADTAVAQAAARALGRIGTTAAAKALSEALAGVSAANQLAVCEGLFHCAETLSANGRSTDALAIYDRLSSLKGPHQVRAGGLRGAILTRGKAGLPLLVQALRGDDFVLVDAAACVAMEMPGTAVTKALTAELPKLSADKQILLTQVLGRRGDAAALPALFTAARSGDKNVRLAAIRALPELRDASAAPVLLELLGETDREIAQTAQESLAALPGSKVDAAVMKMLDSPDTAQRMTALDLIARRRMTAAIPVLLKVGAGPDAKIRPAAMKRVGELAGAGEIPALLDALNQAKNPQDLDAVEGALSTVCAKAGNPDACTDKIVGALRQARPEQKCALLQILSAIGGPKALQSVRAAIKDSDMGVHAAAIRALGSWQTTDAAPDLLALAQNGANPADRSLGLRGYLSLADQPELPAADRLAMCKQAAGSLNGVQEKKLLLGTLGGIKTVEAIAVILPYLNDAEVANEAGAAVLTIADSLLKGKNAARFAPRLVEPLKKVAEVAPNASLASRANALLQATQNSRRKK